MDVKTWISVANLQNEFSGDVVVVGSGPSAQSGVSKIEAFDGLIMACASHNFPPLRHVDIYFASDSFTTKRGYPTKNTTYLISRGVIKDRSRCFEGCKANWYRWQREIPMGMFSGPAAIRMAMYLGFETVYYIGLDGGGHYKQSLQELNLLIDQHKSRIIPL